MTHDTTRLPARGRLLGLDAGERRIGVAVSDPDQRLAVALKTIERRRHGEEFAVIAGIVQEDEVEGVVVGLPLTMSGEQGAQAEKAIAFAREVEERLGLPVSMWDERLSTREALGYARGPSKPGRRDRGRGPSIDTDAVAATIILQAYLDSLARAAL